MNPQEHRRLRELLGAYALGHLAPEEAQRVRAHLDGCAECRAELAGIEPLVPLLDAVDPEQFETPPHPPADLGDRIRAAVAAEAHEPAAPAGTPAGTDVDAPSRWRAVARQPLLVAAAVVLVALVGGLVGRASAPEPPTVPREPIALEDVTASPVSVESADLVPHTWGVELRMVAAGFDEGETYRAAFREGETGRLAPAGAFIGTGAETLVCNLQAAVLRDDVTQVVVTDDQGAVVLVADL